MDVQQNVNVQVIKIVNKKKKKGKDSKKENMGYEQYSPFRVCMVAAYLLVKY